MERYNNNGCHLFCVLLCDQKQQSAMKAQFSVVWRTWSISCVQLLQEHVNMLPAKCLWGGKWVTSTVLRAEIDLY